MLLKPISEMIKEKNYKDLKKLNHIKYKLKLKNLYEQEMRIFLKMVKKQQEDLEQMLENFDEIEAEFKEYIRKWNESINQYTENISAIAAEIAFTEYENKLWENLQKNLREAKLKEEFNTESAKEFKEVLAKTSNILDNVKLLKPSKSLLTEQYKLKTKREKRRKEMQFVNENRFISRKILIFGNKLNDLDYKLLISPKADKERINKEITRIEQQKDEYIRRLNDLPKIYQIKA